MNYKFLFIFVLLTLALIVSATGNTSTSKVLISTIKDKKQIPDYIFENRKRFAKNYNHIVYSDDECIQFLKKYYGTRISKKFQEIKSGAHKADLFRYAYLYKFGGLYMDIKTILIKDLDEIFTDLKLCYFIVTRGSRLMYNGIIYTPPNNPMMYEMLMKSMKIQEGDRYEFNIKHGTDIIRSKVLSTLKLGYNETKDGVPNIIIFWEEFFDKSVCENNMDRHGFCTFVVDERQRRIIKIRDSAYTPNYIN